MADVGLHAEIGRIRADVLNGDAFGRKSAVRLLSVVSELLDRVEKLERHAALEAALGPLPPLQRTKA